MKTHRDLDVWKRSISFVAEMYSATRLFPKEEIYGLTSQMRRAAVSIPSNIAEGAARSSKKEFSQFLHVALGSNAELETQLIISERLNYISHEISEKLSSSLVTIKRMILGLLRKLEK